MTRMPLSDAVRLWLTSKLRDEDRRQAGIAKKLGISPERLSHWVTGHNKIPLDRLSDLARYFGFSSDAEWLAEVRRLYPESGQRRKPAA